MCGGGFFPSFFSDKVEERERERDGGEGERRGQVKFFIIIGVGATPQKKNGKQESGEERREMSFFRFL